MKELKAFFDIFSKLKYVLNKQQKRNSVVILLLLIIGSFLELLGISIVLPFIYAIFDIENLKAHKYVKPILDAFHIQSDVVVISLTIAIVILVYLIKNTALVAIKYKQEKFACGYKKEVSTRMLDAFMHQPYQFFLNVNFAEILRGIFNDVEGSYNMLSTLLNIMTSLFGVCVIGIFLLCTDAFITIGLFITAIICVAVLFIGVKNKTKVMGYKQREISAIAYKSVCQAINGIKDILVMKREKEFLKDYNTAYEEKRKIDITYNCLLTLPNKVIEAIFISGLVVVVGVRAIFMGNESNVEFVAKMALFAVSSVKLLPYISSILSDMTQLVYQRLNIISVYNNLKSTENYEKNITACTGDMLTFFDTLTLKNVSWRYQDAKEDVLHDLSLTIHRGESIGIIGESGAGKSTLVDVMLGLFYPQKGGVYVDGHSIYEDLYGWAHLVGYVPQSIYLLDDTIRNNILFGAENSSDEKIWKALEEARLKSFVESQPKQLDTIVGERGVKMSGGQRQRLAIARTLYYNPEILLLDEATSALDSETEEALMDSIESLMGIKTLIIVAHRLTTIANCNRIFEISNGKAHERKKEEIFH